MRSRGFDFGDFEITKREILASISIIAVMLLIGFTISGRISNYILDRNEKYNKAIKIESSDLFEYGMRTNVGYAFVYGDLKAVDTVSYPEINGEYMYIEKIEEHYNMHTRTVTTTDSKGKTHTRTETYWSYKVSVKSSKWKESTQKFMMNFLRYIFEIQDDLINRTLQNGPTQEFELHERGRIRPITSIQIRDRIVRHSLCDEVLLPEVRKHIIYDNCASIKGRGISQQRKRFEIHLHKYYQLYGNDGYILFGDFSKFYDNIIHEIAKRELLKLFNDDEFIDWLLTLIFKGFQIDVSYMSDEEYETCMIDTFNKLEYRNIPKEKLTGEKWMEKSVNIGDQLSQVIGIYYPYPIDNYVKYVRQQKFYGRYMDDWYIMNPSKEELENLLENVCKIAAELGIHINRKKTRIVKISSKYKFLQIKYTLTDTGKVIKRINPDRVTAMRRKLKKLAVKVENEEADYDNVENMFRGWMGGHYKLLSREQRKNLIQLYEDLFSKEITIVNKKLIVSDRSA